MATKRGAGSFWAYCRHSWARAAQYFAFNVLPSVASKAQMISREDRSMLDIPVAAFAPA